LVVIIIYLFLGNIKAVIVPAVALPVSLIASFLGIYLFDLSINIFVLLSFILAIGIITDDSVIMTDAIYRRIENGENPLACCLQRLKTNYLCNYCYNFNFTCCFYSVNFYQRNIWNFI
jgi:HAE1 family hydrophobic/amphiphilic exporter-1/multidrug efflux pump